MRFQFYTKLLLMFLAFALLPNLSHAQMSKSVGIGEAIIENGDMVAAYKMALDEALIDAIKEYYEIASDNASEIPDITPEYLKFIKSYKITSRTADEFKVNINVEVALDTVTIKDATRFINKRLDTAVFLFKTTPANLATNDIGLLINKILQNNNFSTMDQSNFSYMITDMNDIVQVTNAFSGVNGKYMFQFDFNIKYPEKTESLNVCEIETTTAIKIKRGEEKALKITTVSQNPDKLKCLSEAVSQAVNMTMEYVRTNIIKEEPENEQIHSYEIKVVNFKNMVSTNKLISSLVQKGFINTYKTSAFASKEIVFNVESIFTPDGLMKIIKEAGLDKDMTVNQNLNGLTFDFDLK